MKSKILTIAILSLLLAACSKLTQENYDKITAGMAYSEVTDILGGPDQCSETLGVKKCVWGDEKRHIDINFVGDKVLLTSSENIH